jgi:hypothetical protein
MFVTHPITAEVFVKFPHSGNGWKRRKKYLQTDEGNFMNKTPTGIPCGRLATVNRGCGAVKSQQNDRRTDCDW